MRLIYFFRVMLTGFEALLILIALYVSLDYEAQVQTFASDLSLNQEMLKYLMIFPLGLAAWVLNELRLLLGESEMGTKILVEWPYYWKLKVHVYVSFIYAVIFSCASIAPWVVRSTISTSFGLVLFGTSIAGQLGLATSVYFARIRIKEIMVSAHKI